jgi:hypothetical protein
LAFGLQTTYRIYKNRVRKLIARWQKPVSAAAKPLGSVPPLSRGVFSAQDGAKQKLKIFPQPSGNMLSKSVFKILYVVRSPNGNRKRQSTQLRGGAVRVIDGTQLMRIR